jgi:fumarate reductase flavoprotein subunit
MAAVEAAEQGASVIVLEKQSEIGGSTRLSGGYAAFCETDMQPGTREELLADLRRSHLDDAEEDLSRLYVDDAPSTYRRLLELGLRFSGTMQFANMSKAWGHELPLGEAGGGAQIVEVLSRAADQRGVRTLTGVQGRRLLRDQDTVIGVGVERNRRRERASAKKAVVLASGGFTRNPSLIKTFGRPGTERILPITGAGSHGDGLTMAAAIGASMSYIGRGVAPTTPVEPVSGTGCVVNYFGGILLNKEGHRFCDESMVYVDLCWAGLAQTESMMIQVYDDEARESYGATMVGQVMSGGSVYSADSFDDLFEQLEAAVGLDAQTAASTVRRYNEAAAAGDDPEFGRRHLIGSDGKLRGLDRPPYHAVVAVPGTTHFNGGLKVDATMRVLDVFSDPIPRLFAAGEVVGGFHGSGYMPATHVGSALIFGRRAGSACCSL